MVAVATACLSSLLALSLIMTWPAGITVARASSEPVPLDHPDTVCRKCHEAIYDSYQKTPMGRASGDAVDGLDAAELSAKDLQHVPSGVNYHMFVRDGRAFLAYERAESAHRPALHGEESLAYFIGSGKRGRTYLYEKDDLWFEAPINWYGKKQLWDMAPAYESAQTMPAPLPVDANCLHCHAGEVQASTEGVRNRFDGAPFRAAGIGCAACHGDPAAHLASLARRKQGGGAILNPDKLTPARRDSVCLQCHLEGDATVYLPGKSLAAFKPGDDLSQFAVYFVDSNRAQQGGRATSQYEALLRSACRRAVGDKLTCTTCHDPHSAPEPAQRVAYFRARCLGCHTGRVMAEQHHAEQQDCAVCHMPTRNTLDISHEQLTDHDIEARPAAPAATRAGREPELVPVGGAHTSSREEGLAYAQIAQRGDRKAGEHAMQLLLEASRAGSEDAELHTQLGFLLQLSGAPLGAAEQYRNALRQQPADTTAAANLAVLEAASGHADEAMSLLQQVVREDPSQTAAGLNLAFLECRLGRKTEARDVVQRMLVFHPDSQAARSFLETGLYAGQICRLR